jgi:lysophospholipid acyltransferase (LPLAT)-like uncharacterized protein
VSLVAQHRLLSPEVRFRVAGWGGATLLTTLFATCRIETNGEEHYRKLIRAGQPVVFVVWHGRLLAGAYHQRGNGLVALISEHRDGEYIARVVRRWGYGTIRGSSTRGGTGALRGLLREVRHGRSVVLTPDGPQGPREVMKPGALVVSQLSGAPIVPVATGADRAWSIAAGWDRFQVPKPFSRVQLSYGTPITVPRNLTEVELEEYTARVGSELGALMRKVDDRR